MNLGPAEIDLEKSRPLFFIKPSILHEPVLQDVIKIKDTYKELCEVCEDIACFYGESILVVILCIGGGVIVISYFILLSFFKQIEMFPVMFVNDTMFISWATLQLIVFTSYVSLILKESKRTPIIINSLMSQCVVHDKVEKELLNFLRELAFRKIKFTACEIIPIDRSFLATAAGTVATYLIILIQFRMSTPSE
ncbi:putative gustatory receptor 28a [Cotesia typhae]|uniref:putative gustatory receptor 28a n=1 Tax=Cotesia typhae TaxID=2053667 RepID=UPI003D685D21